MYVHVYMQHIHKAVVQVHRRTRLLFAQGGRFPSTEGSNDWKGRRWGGGAKQELQELPKRSQAPLPAKRNLRCFTSLPWSCIFSTSFIVPPRFPESCRVLAWNRRLQCEILATSLLLQLLEENLSSGRIHSPPQAMPGIKWLIQPSGQLLVQPKWSAPIWSPQEIRPAWRWPTERPANYIKQWLHHMELISIFFLPKNGGSYVGEWSSKKFGV